MLQCVCDFTDTEHLLVATLILYANRTNEKTLSGSTHLARFNGKHNKFMVLVANMSKKTVKSYANDCSSAINDQVRMVTTRAHTHTLNSNLIHFFECADIVRCMQSDCVLKTHMREIVLCVCVCACVACMRLVDMSIGFKCALYAMVNEKTLCDSTYL